MDHGRNRLQPHPNALGKAHIEQNSKDNTQILPKTTPSELSGNKNAMQTTKSVKRNDALTQTLKPDVVLGDFGTTKVVPLYKAHFHGVCEAK
jgi:hypothetical protein